MACAIGFDVTLPRHRMIGEAGGAAGCVRLVAIAALARLQMHARTDRVVVVDGEIKRFALGSALTQTVPNPFYGMFTAGSLTGTTIQNAQLLAPTRNSQVLRATLPATGTATTTRCNSIMKRAWGTG